MMLQLVAAAVILSGTVRDPSGAAMPGVTLEAAGPQGAHLKAVTGATGQYVLSGLGPGAWEITARRTGFLDAHRLLQLSSNNETADFVLDPAPLTQTVTVTEQADYQVAVSETATKTPTPLRDLPQSVSVVNRELIEAQAALSMQDVLRNVPGVSLHLGEGRRDEVYLRGYSAQRDLYLDGVRDDALYYRDLSNVEQVEVVRGPASVLFGRGTPGGLVNRVTKKPSLERPILQTSLAAGSYGTKRLEADLGLPAWEDRLAFRLTGAAEDSGSHRHYYYLKRYSVAPAALWKHSDRTRVLGQAEQLSDDRRPDRGIPSLDGLPAPVGAGAFYGYPGRDFVASQVGAQAVRIEHSFTPGWSFTGVFRHSNYRTAADNTYPTGVERRGSGVLVSRGQYNFSSRQENFFQQDETVVSFSWLGMRHTVLAGFEAGDQSTRIDRFTGAASAVDLFAPVLDRPVYSGAVGTLNAFAGRTYAVYAQDQVTFTPRWKGLFGARRDYFRQRQDNLLNGSALGRTDRNWSPRAGLVYQPTPMLSLYGSYSRSFIPSGVGLTLAANNAELRPETAENYEGGAKAEWLRGRLSSTLAVFRLDRNHIKTTDPVDPTRLVLVGRQRTDGAEVSLAGSLRTRWSIYGGWAWLSTRILRSNSLSSGVPIEGKRAAFIPLNSFHLWSTYTLAGGFGFGGGVYVVGNRFTGNDNLVLLPQYTRVDGTVFYRRRHYEVALNVRNLTNATYYETAHGNFTIYPGAPISGLLTARYRW